MDTEWGPVCLWVFLVWSFIVFNWTSPDYCEASHTELPPGLLPSSESPPINRTDERWHFSFPFLIVSKIVNLLSNAQNIIFITRSIYLTIDNITDKMVEKKKKNISRHFLKTSFNIICHYFMKLSILRTFRKRHYYYFFINFYHHYLHFLSQHIAISFSSLFWYLTLDRHKQTYSTIITGSVPLEQYQVKCFAKGQNANVALQFIDRPWQGLNMRPLNC